MSDVAAQSAARVGEVLCVGLATLDLIFETAAPAAMGGKTFARARREIGGGPASTAAVCVARLGGAASFAGRLGRDRIGDQLEEELRDEGVDTTWLRRFVNIASPSSAILVDRAGERTIVAYSDPAMPSGADWLTPALTAGVVLADMSWPDGALAAMRRAKQAGLPRVLDADRFRYNSEIAWRLVEAASHVIFSRPGLAQLTGVDDVETSLAIAARDHHELVGVTDGADGFSWRCGETLTRQRPPRIDAVDTTGAGDAFHGAFALSLARGEGITQAVRGATAVAAAKCCKPGGRDGLPRVADLAAFLTRHEIPAIE